MKQGVIVWGSCDEGVTGRTTCCNVYADDTAGVRGDCRRPAVSRWLLPVAVASSKRHAADTDPLSARHTLESRIGSLVMAWVPVTLILGDSQPHWSHDARLTELRPGVHRQRPGRAARRRPGAKLGKRVAVVEKQRCVGGVCIETGTIPSKTFREAVRRFYSRPGSNPRSTRRRLAADDGAAGGSRRPGHRARKRTVQGALSATTSNRAGRARSSTHTRAGRHARRPANAHGRSDPDRRGNPPGPPDGPSPTARPSSRRTASSVSRLPRTMAVVGAGVIGIEYASMFAALGVQVTVIDRRPRPLEFLDGEIVDELIHQLRKQRRHVPLRRERRANRRRRGPPRKGLIRLEIGQALVADVILFAAGPDRRDRRPESRRVGLQADHRGRLAVDAHYRTAVPHIYAAGDVIGFPALAATSSEQGRLAACHMFGVEAEPMGDHFPVGHLRHPRSVDGRARPRRN